MCWIADDGAVAGRSRLSVRCMEGRWDTLKEVSRIKLVALIRERCLMWLVIKEHLKRMSAAAPQSYESMNLELKCCSSGGDSMAESFVVPLRLNLYLGGVNLRIVPIESELRSEFAEHQAELTPAWALQLFAAENMSSAVARSFDMVRLKKEINNLI